MRTCKNICALLLLVLAAVGLLLSGCGKDESGIAYGNAVFTRGEVHFLQDHETRTSIFKTYADASAVLTEADISEDVSSVYDEAYFEKNQLLMVAFFGNSVCDYSVNDLTLKDGTLTVCINEKQPRESTLLGVAEVLLIDIPAGALPEDVRVDVQIIEK